MPKITSINVAVTAPKNFKFPMTEAEQNAYMNKFMRRQAGRGETGPGARDTEEQRLKKMLEELGDSKSGKEVKNGKGDK